MTTLEDAHAFDGRYLLYAVTLCPALAAHIRSFRAARQSPARIGDASCAPLPDLKAGALGLDPREGAQLLTHPGCLTSLAGEAVADTRRNHGFPAARFRSPGGWRVAAALVE